ncbi:UV-stimulated scaffold protein A-like [Dreissena polymorpha]|uniref:UV-stimulated scaffold protein A C-terminal domain-containing protein n=1 Tax=Dreissena polymorpha TaxID=45954 RepID=A0A9D4EWS7_DREPO|nr:UV-stimulated scaffold protein A-like [Dreissena polymorpha]KAH3785415.1 hypothetical protein DPMN_163503 [Dreissena polymorpha]
MAEELDETLCKQISGLVQILTTSGKPALNQEVMKKFKKLCRNSDGYVKYAFDIMMKQLHIKHSEVRLSVCQMIDELFSRSHVFRELLLENIHTYFELSTGLDKSLPLPPPKQVAKVMKENVLRNFYLWFEKYGPAYKKLALGYDFMKTCKKVDFDGISATVQRERELQADTDRKMEAIRCEKLQNAAKQWQESEAEIEICVTQVENGLELLLPKPDEFFIPVDVHEVTQSKQEVTTSETMTSSVDMTSQNSSGSSACINKKAEHSEDISKINNSMVDSVSGTDSYCTNGMINRLESDSQSQTATSHDSSPISTSAKYIEPDYPLGSDSENDSEEGVEDSSLGQQHGVFSRQFALTISIGGPENTTVQETEDNAAIIEGIQGQYRLIKNKYLPRVKTWLQTLMDHKGEAPNIQMLTAWRDRLETAVRKCVELEIKASRRNREDSETDDDDFEEVPDKCGYEEDIPEHVKLEAAMTSTGKQNGSKKRFKRKSVAEKKKLKQSAVKMLTLQPRISSTITYDVANDNSEAQEKPDDEVQEPSISQAGSLQDDKQSSSSASSHSTSHIGTTSSHMSDRKQSLFKKAPIVPFGIDIEHWENSDQIKAPSKVKYENAGRFWVPEREQDEGLESAGPSEEVASLTRRTFTYVGHLEPIKWKCRAPLSNGKLCERMDREKCPFHGRIIGRDKGGQPTEADDIERLSRERILKQIEEGFEDSDSDGAQGSKGKGKGKRTRKRKYPNLTDVREKETSRTRLEAKIFNRATLRKVSNALDADALKKISEKFGNQFNYSLK